jgi:hypothetical protein
MLDRYNVIDEAELAAVAKRFANGKQTANMTPSAPAPNFRPQQFLDPCLTIRRAPVCQPGAPFALVPHSVTSGRSSS